MTAQGFTDKGSYTPDNLFGGEFPRVQRIETITGGKDLKRGAVLGCLHRNGFYVLSEINDAAKKEGSAHPCAILAEDVDASSGDKQAAVYHSGEFNASALIYGKGHNADNVWRSFRNIDHSLGVGHCCTIFIRNNQGN